MLIARVVVRIFILCSDFHDHQIVNLITFLFGDFVIMQNKMKKAKRKRNKRELEWMHFR